MPALSIPIPHVEGSASEQAAPTAPEKVLTANKFPGYRLYIPKVDAIRKCLAPIPDNARARIWMYQDLSLYPNSVYVYAIVSIAIALSWDKGGREIAESKPLSMICAILTHCLNTMDINIYSVRTKGQRFCQDSMLIASSPLAHLEVFGKFKDGRNHCL